MPVSLTLRVPGKLMIAGEYAVLEPHQPSLVAAVDRHVTAHVALAADYRVELPDLGVVSRFEPRAAGLRFEHPAPELRFVTAALTVAFAYLRAQFLMPLPFGLRLESALADASGRKFGLGSSAAVTVATVAAVLNLLNDDEAPPPAPDLLFKLAAIAHFEAQGSGSGADVAASTYGGWLRYSSFNPEWLAERLGREEPLARLLDAPWPFLSVERLSPLPRDLCLCVGWTGEPASTHALIERVRALRDRDAQAYGDFLAESARAVDHLVAGLTSANRGRALEGLERNRQALQALGAHAGVAVETPALAELARWARVTGGAGKPSGAGGGDCGVALVFGEDKAAGLASAWEQAGLEPLRLGVSDAGVTVVAIEP